MKILIWLPLMMLVHAVCPKAADFESHWPAKADRVWIGTEFWANRLQDWRIRDGRLECTQADPDKPVRTVHLLTHRLIDETGSFKISVITGSLGEKFTAAGWSGFLIGAGEKDMDYRGAALVHHRPGRGGGILAVVQKSGRAVFRDMEQTDYKIIAETEKLPPDAPGPFLLKLAGRVKNNRCTLEFIVMDTGGNTVISKARLENIDAARIFGNVALVSHPGQSPAKDGPGSTFWFRDWMLSGPCVAHDPGRTFGPVLAVQYTLHRQELLLTAQFPPLGENDDQKASLEIRTVGDTVWQKADEKRIVKPGYTAGFVVKNWDDGSDHDYRIVFPVPQNGDETGRNVYSGVIRHNPVDESVIRVAAFTGNMNMHHTAQADKGERWADTKVILTSDAVRVRWTYDNVWFPHAELVRYVQQQSPDLLFFSGDQIYENAPTRSETSELDYLYKWYLWCWAYADLTRNIPVVTIPDDHDVYQGNLWGAGGRACKDIHKGGYRLPADLVNMIQRTQTSHLPAPYDRTPVQRGIGVYYTWLDWGGVSFAVIEDRKFKTGPAILPDSIPRDGPWISQNYEYMDKLDVPGAVLLGDRQLNFLRAWVTDWPEGVEMKALLSQTNFNSVHTRPDQKLARDLDKNSWPQTGRRLAVDVLRRGFAVHICGDQHLGTTIHYGVENWQDASVAFCVPSIAVGHQRVWEPPTPGYHHQAGMPDYTGSFFDAFGNRMTVYAAANPVRPGELSEAQKNRKRAELYRKRSGYGIIDFDKIDRTITMQCWPRETDPSAKNAAQFTGWPVTVHQLDNFGGPTCAFLPVLQFPDGTKPVVRIINEKTGQIENAIRINTPTFQPRVLKPGKYTIRVNVMDEVFIFKNIPAGEKNDRVQKIDLDEIQ